MIPGLRLYDREIKSNRVNGKNNIKINETNQINTFVQCISNRTRKDMVGKHAHESCTCLKCKEKTENAIQIAGAELLNSWSK